MAQEPAAAVRPYIHLQLRCVRRPSTTMIREMPTAAEAATYEKIMELSTGIFADVSEDNLWKPRPSVACRFPGVDGSLRWMIYQKHYVKERNSHCNFFAEGAERIEQNKLLSRSEVNNRDEMSNRQECKNTVKTEGLQFDWRSRAVSIPFATSLSEPPVHSEARKILAGMHLVDGTYDAWFESPENPLVLAAIRDGIDDVFELYPKTPPDAQYDFVDIMNRFGQTN